MGWSDNEPRGCELDMVAVEYPPDEPDEAERSAEDDAFWDVLLHEAEEFDAAERLIRAEEDAAEDRAKERSEEKPLKTA